MSKDSNQARVTEDGSEAVMLDRAVGTMFGSDAPTQVVGTGEAVDIGTLDGSVGGDDAASSGGQADKFVKRVFDQAHIVEGVDGQFKCGTCQNEFEKKFEATKHSLKHTKPYKCTICGEGSAQKKDAHRHVNSVHKDVLGSGAPPGFQCMKCLKKFDRLDNMQRHYARCKGSLVMGKVPTWGERLRREIATVGGIRLAPAPRPDELVSQTLGPSEVSRIEVPEKVVIRQRNDTRLIEVYLRADVQDYEVRVYANSEEQGPGNSYVLGNTLNVSHLREGDKSLTLRFG